MKKQLLIAMGLLLTCYYSKAQFNSDSSKTFFVCDTTGSQSLVSAFGDGNGGTYSFWIDKRNGSSGSAIYGQHLDSLGMPQWTKNGKLFYQQNAKEIWLMKAVAWQSGILVSWIQGGFGVGGDTLYCNYYNNNGISQWTQPTVAANKQGSIIYVGIDNLDIYPNDSGATVTYGLTYSGGNSVFSFNRIDFNGNLRWPLDTFSYQGNGYYYQTGYDNHNGFYVATSTGGLGALIYMGHFDLQGNQTMSSPIDITGTAGGRGNSQWKIICDNDSNAYVIWASYTNNNISISKIKPDGTKPWSDAKQICAATGLQDYPDVMIKNDTIYSIWDDARPGASGYEIYMQKTDTAGNMLWTPDGILLSNLNSYIPYPKLVKSGNNIIATYLVGGSYHAQKIKPDSTIIWNQNGIVINVPNPPFYGDYQLIPSANGNVTAIWKEVGENICAARIRPNGTLTAIENLTTEHVVVYPNPASNIISIVHNQKNAVLNIYNEMGNLIFYQNIDNSSDRILTLNTTNYPSGIYSIVLFNGEHYSIKRVVVIH